MFLQNESSGAFLSDLGQLRQHSGYKLLICEVKELAHLTDTEIYSLKIDLALAIVAQLVGVWSRYQNLVGLGPGHGTDLGCGFNSWFRCVWEATSWCFSFALICFSIPSSFSKAMKILSLGEDKYIYIKINNNSLKMACQSLILKSCFYQLHSTKGRWES